MSGYEVGTLVFSGISTLTAVVGLILVYRQLQTMVESIKIAVKDNKIAIDNNRNANLMTVLALEESVGKSRAEMSDAAIELGLIKDEEREQISESTALKLAKLRFEEKTEQYLNALDRLCSCIVRGYIDEEQYRQDYRNGVAETIKNHKNLFGADTRHRNILAVHNAWSEDKLVYQKSSKQLTK